MTAQTYGSITHPATQGDITALRRDVARLEAEIQRLNRHAQDEKIRRLEQKRFRLLLSLAIPAWVVGITWIVWIFVKVL